MTFEIDPIDQTLMDFAQGLLDQFGWTSPPVDMNAIAEWLDVSIVEDDSVRGRGILRCDDGRYSIWMKPPERPERRHSIIAHELGELMMERIANCVGERLDSRQREKAAYRFAMFLLVPQDALKDAIRRHGYDLFAHKEIFTTASHHVIAERWRWVDKSQLVTVFDWGKMEFPKKWERPPVMPIEWQAQREANRTKEPVVVRDGEIEVAAWPIHDLQTGWPREILRTTFAAW